MLLLITLLLSVTTNASGQYKEAIKVATDAALKQSGLETDWFKVRSAGETKAKKTVRKLGLEKPAAAAAFIIPVVIKQRIRIRTGDFTINGGNNKAEVKWQIQW